MTCQLCERNEAAGYLCAGCTLATARTLDRMPRLYDALAAFLQPAGRRPELGHARPAEAPLPVSEPVLNLRGPGGIAGVLEAWRSAMQADRGWGQPAITGTVERRVLAASRGLSLNLEWVAASWPLAGAMAEEIRDLERDVLSIVDPREPTLRIGECAAVLPDASVCAAVLRVPPGTTEVRCRWCGTPYPPSTWLALKTGDWEEADGGERPADTAELRR
ncbi:hypothetical protein [Streptomyces synnematoformans]|uniref:Uncharacterized protein n=1 Tax=Streptomyces synnematoformans TaxID=415721 RepID=A0ABN2XC07_9ACTN